MNPSDLIGKRMVGACMTLRNRNLMYFLVDNIWYELVMDGADNGTCITAVSGAEALKDSVIEKLVITETPMCKSLCAFKTDKGECVITVSNILNLAADTWLEVRKIAELENVFIVWTAWEPVEDFGDGA